MRAPASIYMGSLVTDNDEVDGSTSYLDLFGSEEIDTKLNLILF